MLFFFMILFVLSSVAFIGWGVYSQWEKNRLNREKISVASLSTEEITLPKNQEERAVDDTPSQEAIKKDDKKEEVVAKNYTVAVSVLNGGAPKGSAGVMASILKESGYLSVTPSNTIKDYVGVVVYYADTFEKQAEYVKEILVKKYPQAKIMSADTKNKETSVSPITIILGK